MLGEAEGMFADVLYAKDNREADISFPVIFCTSMMLGEAEGMFADVLYAKDNREADISFPVIFCTSMLSMRRRRSRWRSGGSASGRSGCGGEGEGGRSFWEDSADVKRVLTKDQRLRKSRHYKSAVTA